MASKFCWAYHLTEKELMEVYFDAGGTPGPYKEDDLMLLMFARRAVFQYLMPGDVESWYASIDDVDGFLYIIGTHNAKLESIPKELLGRCHDMFLREPEKCARIPVPGHAKFTLERDGKTHIVELYYFWESVLACMLPCLVC